MTEVRRAAAAVVVRGDRVLLVRRRVAEGALSWQFPAGKIEPGGLPRKPQHVSYGLFEPVQDYLAAALLS